MEKFDTTISEEAHIINGELATLFKVMSNPDTLKILYRAGMGIENSTFAMKEMGLSSKRYYARLRDLIDIGLVRKKDRVYRQTALGRIIYERFLPAMGKTFDARDDLELIVYLEGAELDSGIRKLIEDKLEIPGFAKSPKVNLFRDYEDLAVAAVDLYDYAEDSVLLASNYWDVRVMEAVFRATERGITNRLIVGKKSLSSKLHNLRMMLSVSFAKTIINFTSNKVNLKDFVRFADLPYTFGVVDGHFNIIDISNPINEKFVFALSIDDRDIGEKLTDFYEILWKSSETQSALKVVDSIVTKLNGETPHQYRDL